MPTILYPRTAKLGIATYGNGAAGSAMLAGRGAAASSVSGTTTASGTWISLGYFATPPLNAFTLTGSISCNLRGLEANTNANASLGVRFYKWTRSAGLGALIVQASATVELGTAETAVAATATAPSTAFANGDVLVAEMGIINIGSMGSGRAVTLYFNGPTAGASGDSYITIPQTITQQRRAAITG